MYWVLAKSQVNRNAISKYWILVKCQIKSKSVSHTTFLSRLVLPDDSTLYENALCKISDLGILGFTYPDKDFWLSIVFSMENNRKRVKTAGFEYCVNLRLLRSIFSDFGVTTAESTCQ